MRRVIIVVVAVLLALPIVNAQSYDPCQTNADCTESGYYCVGGQCREPCQNNNDCDEGTCQQDGYCGNGPQCGDSVVEGSEECDVGDTVDCDGCSATCQLEICGDGNVCSPEQCDDGNTNSCDSCSPNCINEFCGDFSVCDPEQCDDGRHCSNGVSCVFDAECALIGDELCLARNNDGCDNQCQSEQQQESPSPSASASPSPSGKPAPYVLFDLAVGHNMLFSKVMDLLHIIKEALFQLEIKMVEIQLTNNPCNQQPVSFWIPADLNPYGKLNEIDALIELLIKSIQDGQAAGGNFGGPDIGGAQSRLNEADMCIGFSQFREAFECKCLAYRENLLGLVDESDILCEPCLPIGP